MCSVLILTLIDNKSRARDYLIYITSFFLSLQGFSFLSYKISYVHWRKYVVTSGYVLTIYQKDYKLFLIIVFLVITFYVFIMFSKVWKDSFFQWHISFNLIFFYKQVEIRSALKYLVNILVVWRKTANPFMSLVNIVIKYLKNNYGS